MKCIVREDVVPSRPPGRPAVGSHCGFAKWVRDEGYA
jgi:hypothetical protein